MVFDARMKEMTYGADKRKREKGKKERRGAGWIEVNAVRLPANCFSLFGM